MSDAFTTEQDLAARVVRWLADQDFQVYQEVQLLYGGRIADIVGRRGAVLIVVETKLQFGLDVVEQAFRWIGDANYVLVAIPALRRRGGLLLERICRDEGVGVLLANEYRVEEVIAPRLFRRIGDRLRNGLVEAQQTWAAAGNADGKRWSPFQQTARTVAEYVGEHPGCTLRELVTGIRHHYFTSATARGALRKWIELGKIPGARMERHGRELRLFPVAAVAQPVEHPPRKRVVAGSTPAGGSSGAVVQW